MNRRHFLMTAAGSTAFAQRRQSTPPPNIVLILADDLAAWHLGCYGNKEIRTPNIDTLARTGIRFANSFVCTPICSASRATLFTGRVPRQHGIHDFLTSSPIEKPPQGQLAPPPSFEKEVMISDVLAGRGYNCGYVGKWHMGNDATPGHGYQFTYTMPGGSQPYQNPVMFLNGEKRQESGYMTDLMTQQALRYLDKQSANKPFFLTVSYFNPHLPYSGHPQKYYDMYGKTSFDTIGWKPAAPNALREKDLLGDIVGNLRKAAASTTALDDQIPILLRKLQERGLRDNTIVVFTGDNGFLYGRHGLWSKGLASDPINMYDEVMQVPMLVSWPGKIPAEAVSPDMVSFYDFLPTLCEAAGAAVPAGRNLVGRSYWPIVTREPLPKKQPWKQMVFGHFRNTEMARDHRHKLVLRNDGAGPNELFDLTQDRGEMVNQFENPQYVTVRDRLRTELDNWRKRAV
ncbi:MAG TPA: sulfatase-like hydrolase/transferase [Bryobacteraceae bacterium]|nr:sulfatase-like hydrolase/transferase [Bryobacteraceae bacterium]